MDRIILASASPRRKQLLEWAEIPFDVMPADADESIPANAGTEEIPIIIARRKAAAIQGKNNHNRVILAADTLVVVGGEILGKPADRTDAVRMLNLLSNREHRVITGVCLHHGQQEISFAETTSVWFHSLGAEEITYYVDQFRPYDKAGAYAIQEWIGVRGIKAIQGDFYNVMGLPVSRVAQALHRIFNAG